MSQTIIPEENQKAANNPVKAAFPCSRRAMLSFNAINAYSGDYMNMYIYYIL